MSFKNAILVKIDEDTKRKMKKVGINWSAEIREFINERLTKKNNVALAVALTDRVFKNSKKNQFDSTEFIRKMRDTRYGKNSD
jgi:hydroxymethylpyrimidine/phosphomethylpyrimidine kinase